MCRKSRRSSNFLNLIGHADVRSLFLDDAIQRLVSDAEAQPAIGDTRRIAVRSGIGAARRFHRVAQTDRRGLIEIKAGTGDNK
jgi:hypothetical protein